MFGPNAARLVDPWRPTTAVSTRLIIGSARREPSAGTAREITSRSSFSPKTGRARAVPEPSIGVPRSPARSRAPNNAPGSRPGRDKNRGSGSFGFESVAAISPVSVLEDAGPSRSIDPEVIFVKRVRSRSSSTSARSGSGSGSVGACDASWSSRDARGGAGVRGARARGARVASGRAVEGSFDRAASRGGHASHRGEGFRKAFARHREGRARTPRIDSRARAIDEEMRARTRARSRTPSMRSLPPNPSSSQVVPSRDVERRATGERTREARQRRNHPEGRRQAVCGRRARFENRTIDTRARRRVVPRAAHRPVACRVGATTPYRAINRSAARDETLVPNFTGKQSHVFVFRKPFRVRRTFPRKIRDDVAGCLAISDQLAKFSGRRRFQFGELDRSAPARDRLVFSTSSRFDNKSNVCRDEGYVLIVFSNYFAPDQSESEQSMHTPRMVQ